MGRYTDRYGDTLILSEGTTDILVGIEGSRKVMKGLVSLTPENALKLSVELDLFLARIYGPPNEEEIAGNIHDNPDLLEATHD